MQTFNSQSQPSGSPHSFCSPAVSLLSTASITLVALLLLLTIPACDNVDNSVVKVEFSLWRQFLESKLEFFKITGAPAELQQAATDTRQLLSQIEAMCSSYLSADLKFWTSDVLGELCVLMLVQKSKELKVRELSKRSPLSHPLLHLVSQLNTRREKGISERADIQGPGGIQSRGYFLYRPRNGRRSLEYE